ncbi:MAG: TonB-dependent receptor [Prevotellaceae bacterium]|nr:TonB-dependent receptor [Prevotellaceae bacterium]
MKREFSFLGLCLAATGTCAAADAPRDSLRSYRLEEVVVAATRAGEHGAAACSEVGREAIARRNFGQDVPYLLALTPSFVPTSDAGAGIGYTGFRVRGTDANRVSVLVNGIPVSDAESHGTFFVNMPDLASSLGSVQVQRGVGVSVGGTPSFGASINMQTEGVHADPFAEVGAALGSFGASRYTVKAGTGILPGRFALEGRVSGIDADGYVDRAAANLKSYFFSGGYYGERTALKYVSFGGREKTYQAWNGVDLAAVRTQPLAYSRTYNELGRYVDEAGSVHFYDNQTDNYTQLHHQLHWVQRLAPELRLSAALHYTSGLGYYEEYVAGEPLVRYGLAPAEAGGEETSDIIRRLWMDNDFYGATAALHYTAPRLSAVLGGGANRYDGRHFGRALWAQQAAPFDPERDFYRSTSAKTDANAYLRGSAEVLRGLFATADVQYRHVAYTMQGTDDKYDAAAGAMRDISRRNYFNFLNPKLGVEYKVSERQEAYASFAVANREPNRNTFLVATGADEQPTAERLYDAEVGYRYASPRLSAEANLYYMRYKDQLILTGKINEIGEPLASNIPDSYRAGVELALGVKVCDQLRWDANLTLSRNKILNFVEKDVDVYDSDFSWQGVRENQLGTTDIAYSPGVVAGSVFTFTLGSFEAGLHTSYVGRQQLDNTSSAERTIDPYLVSNLTLSYALPLEKQLKRAALQLLVGNLFNEEYETNGYTWYSYYLGEQRCNELRHFPQAGTSFMLKLELTF